MSSDISLQSLCSHTSTVTSEFANAVISRSSDGASQNGSAREARAQETPISHIVKDLANNQYKRPSSGSKSGTGLSKLKDDFTKQELDYAARCGKFGDKPEDSRPSDLFLKIYWEVLKCLETDPFIGMVSPPLLGSRGVIPLSIISVIPDIQRHYATVISRAQSEIFLATSYWQPSHSVTLVSDALRKLSRTVGEQGGKKVVVKIMYDRGTPRQLIQPHSPVEPKDWKKVDLPSAEEIPNLELEVINYHVAPLGTFHTKFLVVDRSIACINSNNHQDRPNLEMCVHLEGPVVDSFYDMALICWSNVMKPPLPLLAVPIDWTDDKYKFGQDNVYIKSIDLTKASKVARKQLFRHHTALQIPQYQHPPLDPLRRPTRTMTMTTIKNSLLAKGMKSSDFGTLTEGSRSSLGSPTDDGGERKRIYESRDNGSYETLEDSRSAISDDLTPMASQSHISRMSEEPEEEEDLHTDGGAESLLSPLELSPSLSSERIEEISFHLNAAGTTGTRPTQIQDMPGADDFEPHVLHNAHKSVPIAMVNRPPHGMPGHGDGQVPQNIAWLAGVRFAKRKVFIQTPTFNAKPIVAEVLNAVRRGVLVELFLDLGFNDQGEMAPFQGGTNEDVVERMYKELRESKGAEENLKVYWYTGKDQNVPVNAALKTRNCHIKFCAIDDEVGIVGNGNQDTQSWYHSQEINIMVDSPSIVQEWINALHANQNTHIYGGVDPKDGIWKDKDGKPSLQGTGKRGVFATINGMVEIAKKAAKPK